MAKSPFDSLQNSFHSAEKSLSVDSSGNGGYSVAHPLTPGAGMKSAQSPAQHASVKRAAQASVAKRRARAGKLGV